MASIIDNIGNTWRQATLLMRIIYINVAVFVLLHVVGMILTLCNISPDVITGYLSLPSQPMVMLRRVWTLFTYMYVHYDLWHILFNMLWLYWFGNIFTQYFTPRQLNGLYIMGGLAGALFYLLSYNIFPYFADKPGMMCGASAAIMAIVLATTMRVPDYKVNLLFIGAVSLKWIAVVTVAIDLMSMTGANAGGHIAHIGGAVMGILYAVYWKRGHDLTRPVNAVVDFVATLGKSRQFTVHNPGQKPPTGSTQHHTQRRAESDQDYNARKKQEMDEIDRILDKIKKSGYTALTEEEKKRLFDAGNRN